MIHTFTKTARIQVVDGMVFTNAYPSLATDTPNNMAQTSLQSVTV